MNTQANDALYLQPTRFPEDTRHYGWREIISMRAEQANEIVLSSPQVRDWVEKMAANAGMAVISPATDVRLAQWVATRVPGLSLWYDGGRWHCRFDPPGKTWDWRLSIYANSMAMAICRGFIACFLYEETINPPERK